MRYTKHSRDPNSDDFSFSTKPLTSWFPGLAS